MTIAAYVRVSTRHQKNDSQILEIEKWINASGLDTSQVIWYCDKESGRTLQRPEFERLQADIFSGKIKTVVLYKLDRLSRRLKDGINTLADWCEKNVRIVVTSQNLDLNGAVGRMIAALLLGLAELEWEFRKDRQAIGIEAARKRGVYLGRKKGTTKGTPERARELRGKGLTASEIATSLGVNKRTIFRYLADE